MRLRPFVFKLLQTLIVYKEACKPSPALLPQTAEELKTHIIYSDLPQNRQDPWRDYRSSLHLLAHIGLIRLRRGDVEFHENCFDPRYFHDLKGWKKFCQPFNCRTRFLVDSLPADSPLRKIDHPSRKSMQKKFCVVRNRYMRFHPDFARTYRELGMLVPDLEWMDPVTLPVSRKTLALEKQKDSAAPSGPLEEFKLIREIDADPVKAVAWFRWCREHHVSAAELRNTIKELWFKPTPEQMTELWKLLKKG